MTRPPVTVEHLAGDRYRVRVGDLTEHEVRASAQVLERIAREGEAPGATLVRAFEFLLDRESAGSILRRFALEDIARYFPEFWTEMRGRPAD